MELFYAGLSDVGNARPNNEDYQFAGKIGNEEYLFIVADGMGGHNAGEIASRSAVTELVNKIETKRQNNLPVDLEPLIAEINDILYIESTQISQKSGMGTTLSVLYVRDDLGFVGHVGDSRIYRYYNGSATIKSYVQSLPNDSTRPESIPQLVQLTEDHSFVGKLLKDGLINEEEARNHPRRNVIYQSIGSKAQISVHVLPPIPIKKGQKFILCSDGLYGVVPDNDIKNILTGPSPVIIARQLIQEAKRNGGPDNITVIVVCTEIDANSNTHTAPDTDPFSTAMDASASVPVVKKRRRIGLFVLLGLLLLLLGAIIFFLVVTTPTHLQ
jgi:PPM family protein phosphatase